MSEELLSQTIFAQLVAEAYSQQAEALRKSDRTRPAEELANLKLKADHAAHY